MAACDEHRWEGAEKRATDQRGEAITHKHGFIFSRLTPGKNKAPEERAGYAATTARTCEISRLVMGRHWPAKTVATAIVLLAKVMNSTS